MDVQGILFSVAQQLAEALNAQRCTIRIPDGRKMKLVALYGDDSKKEEFVDIEGTIVGEAFETGEILNIRDITKDPRYNPYYISHNDSLSLIAIPLIFEGEKLGVAQVYARNQFTEKQVALAKNLSQFAALTIYYEFFRRKIRKSFLKIIESIIKGDTFEEISQRAVEQIVKNIQIERVTVYRIYRENNQLFCEISAGIPKDDHGIGLREEIVKHPDIQKAIECDNFFIINDPEKNLLTSHFVEIVRFKRINSILYIPVNKNIVLVADATKEKRSFTEEEIEFCSEVTYILYLVWQRIKKDLEAWRDKTINPAVSIGGWSKRLSEVVKIITEEVQKLEKNIPEKI